MTSQLRAMTSQTITRLSLAVFFVFALPHCSDSDFREYKQLSNLRILALVASTPEVNAGATVTITPVVSDVDGAGRTITAEAMACADPGVSYGANPTCVGVSGAQTITIGGGATYALTGPTFTGTGNTFNVTVPTDYLSGKSTAQSLIGVAYLVTYRISAAGETQEGFKRIVVSTNPVKNSKPGLTGVLSGGASLTQLPAAATNLTPNISAASSETYPAYNTDGSVSTVTETLTTTWFASKASVSLTRTEGSASNAYSPSLGANDVLVLVTRDERGGASYCIISLTAISCG